MTTTEKSFNIQNYLSICLRRKWSIIIPLVCSLIISFWVYKFLPKVYKATTLILVQKQQVPESYVRPTITSSITDRLNTISQEILSRTRLEKIIQEFNLYADMKGKEPLEVIVEKMRRAIGVNVQGGGTQNTFTVSYEGVEPRQVMLVTNKLASLFIEENLKVRELQAENTSVFLSKELTAVEEELVKKENDLRDLKKRHMGQLPQQLEANLRILERLQYQLKTVSDNIKAAEDRSMLIQNQIEDLKKQEIRQPLADPKIEVEQYEEGRPREKIPESPIVAQWNLLMKELENAQARYRENHPDVILLKRKIAKIEPQAKEILAKKESMDMAEAQQKALKMRHRTSSSQSSQITLNLSNEKTINQYTERYKAALLEVRRLKEEEKNLKEQIHLYQVRIEETPKREQEILLITRDYDLLRANYSSLMNKKIQSQLAENLERKQQGEQFKILDVARLPERPFKPKREQLFLIGAFIGLMGGLGLAWFREDMDESFHSEADLEAHLDLPILAVIPNLKEENKAIKA